MLKKHVASSEGEHQDGSKGTLITNLTKLLTDRCGSKAAIVLYVVGFCVTPTNDFL